MKETNKILFAYLLVIVSIILLASCQKYPVSEAVKDLNRAYVNHPDTTGALTRAWFPCIVTKSDTVTKIVDSLIYIECPEVTATAEDYAGKDTVKITQIKTVRVPVTLPIKYITIKEKIEDSAKIKLYASELDKTYKKNYDLQKNVEQLTADKAELKAALKKQRWWLLILLAVFGGAIVLRIKRIL